MLLRGYSSFASGDVMPATGRQNRALDALRRLTRGSTTSLHIVKSRLLATSRFHESAV